MKNLNVTDFFADLKPSTIMLLEYYFYIMEDAHSRNSHLYKIKQKEDRNKLKDLGYLGTNKEVQDKYKEIGSKNQYRTYIRSKKKDKKELKKIWS